MKNIHHVLFHTRTGISNFTLSILMKNHKRLDGGRRLLSEWRQLQTQGEGDNGYPHN